MAIRTRRAVGIRPSPARVVFNVVNHILLIGGAFLCLVPMIHILAISLSSPGPVAAQRVSLWPVQFTWSAYEWVVANPDFLRAMWVSFQRLGLAVPLSLLFTVVTAYPLSKERKYLRSRAVYVWFFFLTMLFSGGLIPSYMIVLQTGLIDTIWALVVPALTWQVFNMILVLNFFRQLPKSLEEAAYVDGASHWIVLFRVYIPLSKPVIATITLFTAVTHWNSWFDGMIYMNFPENQPLSTYIRNILQTLENVRLTISDVSLLEFLNNDTARAAQIFVAALPIILVYPFLQRYFAKGIILGSVKG